MSNIFRLNKKLSEGVVSKRRNIDFQEKSHPEFIAMERMVRYVSEACKKINEKLVKKGIVKVTHYTDGRNKKSRDTYE